LMAFFVRVIVAASAFDIVVLMEWQGYPATVFTQLYYEV